jgi:hypothetical protein
MHELTIAAETGTLTSRHDDFGDARHALLAHARRTDTYLRALDECTPCVGLVSFQLVSLDDAGRRPHLAGTATITPAPVTAGAAETDAARISACRVNHRVDRTHR